MKTLRFLSVVIFLLVFGIISYSQKHEKKETKGKEYCSEILRDGIFRKEVYEKNYFSFISLVQEIRTLNKQQAEEKLGIVGEGFIKGLPVGAQYTNEQYNTFIREMEKNVDFKKIEKNKESYVRTAADGLIVAAWKACIFDGGLDLSFECPSDTLITITFEWIPLINVTNNVIHEVIIRGADIDYGGEYTSEFQLNGRYKGKIGLIRKREADVTVIFQTEKADEDLFIPAIKKIPKIYIGYIVEFESYMNAYNQKSPALIKLGSDYLIYRIADPVPGTGIPTHGLCRITLEGYVQAHIGNEQNLQDTGPLSKNTSFAILKNNQGWLRCTRKEKAYVVNPEEPFAGAICPIPRSYVIYIQRNE